MDQTIVRAAIHPAIGVARVGNSSSSYFYGPEVPNQAPEPPGFYRDSQGALKRQAARFRIGGDLTDHVQGDGLDRRTAIAAMGNLSPHRELRDKSLKVNAHD